MTLAIWSITWWIPIESGPKSRTWQTRRSMSSRNVLQSQSRTFWTSILSVSLTASVLGNQLSGLAVDLLRLSPKGRRVSLFWEAGYRFTISYKLGSGSGCSKRECKSATSRGPATSYSLSIDIQPLKLSAQICLHQNQSLVVHWKSLIVMTSVWEKLINISGWLL